MRWLLNKVIAGEAVRGADFADCDRMPRSPMMTVSGLAAEGPPAADETRRIAAECVSPQLTAVLGSDTELRFAVTPVITFFPFGISATKLYKISHPTTIFLLMKSKILHNFLVG